MYDLITWHSSALHLYICLVRPPPQAYQSKPFSPSHFPYSFILINSQVWKDILYETSNWNSITGKMSRSMESISESLRNYYIKICLNAPCCNTWTGPNGLFCKKDTPFTNSLYIGIYKVTHGLVGLGINISSELGMV